MVIFLASDASMTVRLPARALAKVLSFYPGPDIELTEPPAATVALATGGGPSDLTRGIVAKRSGMR
jgi:hypothetical protein